MPPAKAPPSAMGEEPIGECVSAATPLGWGDKPGRSGVRIRCCCKARAFCIISMGMVEAAAGGRLALLRVPVRLELALIGVVAAVSETVRSDGTRLGRELGETGAIMSEPPLGGSKGVLASESSSEPGEAGLLSSSSGVGGIESGSAMMGEGCCVLGIASKKESPQHLSSQVE
jgi:hypothetical protein